MALIATYQSEDYMDLVNTTLRNLERVSWADIVVDLQRFIAMQHVFKVHRIVVGSGYGHQFNVRLFSNEAARNVRLNEEDNPTTADMHQTGTIPWRNTTTNWSIEERLIAQNRTPARLVDLVQSKRVDSLTSLATVMEQNWWDGPSSTADDLTPYGVPSWITPGPADSAGDFVGGDTSSISGGAGGLLSTTYPRWQNWFADYDAVTRPDLIRKWREAATKTDFRPPVQGPYSNLRYRPVYSADGSGYNEQREFDCEFYTTYNVLRQTEEILEGQNDNLGRDLAYYDGETHFRRTPVRWVPYLDQNPNAALRGLDPVYGINWLTFHPIVLEGEWLRETEIRPYPFKHRTLTQHLDCTYNFFCNDRRRNFLLSQVS